MKKKVAKKAVRKKAVKKSVSKRVAKTKELDFWKAFNYPFNKATRMFNILWILLPIFGWFALFGYGLRIVREFVEGKFDNLPEFSFGSDMKLGVIMFLKAIPFILAYIIAAALLIQFSKMFGVNWLVGFADTFVEIFIIPVLGINFIVKGKLESFFEFRIVRYVFENFGDYVLAMLKSILLAIIFLVMWIVLIGFPAGVFTQNMFLADFYRRRVK